MTKCAECQTEMDDDDLRAWTGPDMITIEDSAKDTVTVLVLPPGEICWVCAEEAVLPAVGVGHYLL